MSLLTRPPHAGRGQRGVGEIDLRAKQSCLDACGRAFLYCAMVPPRIVFSTVMLPILVGLFTLAGGCGSKGPQYPEEHARFRRIDAAVEALRKAYVGKDLSGVKALTLPIESLEQMESEVQRDFQEFHQIALDFSIDRIVIEGEQVDVFVHWQGQWKRAAGDAGVRERGHGMLRWTGVQSILLNGLDGDLPFGMANRHTVPSFRPPS